MAIALKKTGCENIAGLEAGSHTVQKLYFETAVRTYSARLRSVGCNSAARKLKANFLMYAETMIMEQLGSSWQEVLDTLLMDYCCSVIQSKIRRTPQQFRQLQWPKELLDQLILTCGLDERSRYRLYREAGWECPVPDGLIRLSGNI